MGRSQIILQCSGELFGKTNDCNTTYLLFSSEFFSRCQCVNERIKTRCRSSDALYLQVHFAESTWKVSVVLKGGGDEISPTGDEESFLALFTIGHASQSPR